MQGPGHRRRGILALGMQSKTCSWSPRWHNRVILWSSLRDVPRQQFHGWKRCLSWNLGHRKLRNRWQLAANGAFIFPWAKGPHDQAMNVSCQCENEWMQISFQSACNPCAGAMQTVSTAANVSNSSLKGWAAALSFTSHRHCALSHSLGFFSALDFLFNFRPRICFANKWHYRHWELPSFPGMTEAGFMVTGYHSPACKTLG